MDSKLLLVLVITIAVAALTLGQPGPLTSASVDETPAGGCLAPTVFQGDILWSYTPRNYYFPMGSQHFYRYWAEALLGRSANDQAELDTIALYLSFVGGVTILTGFGPILRVIPWTCVPVLSLNAVLQNRILQISCTALVAGPGTNTSNVANAIVTQVWSDNSAVLATLCYNGNIFDWAVLSALPTLTPAQTATILDIVEGLGFKKNKAEVISYGSSPVPLTEMFIPIVNGTLPLLPALTGPLSYLLGLIGLFG